jgi:synaptobrevin family protein YKT6
MKLLGLFIMRVVSAGEPVICCHSVDVSSVGFFQRSSAKEFLIFLARTVSKRVTPGSRNQVSQDAHVIYCQSRSDGLAAVAICDSEYNNRVAFTLLSTILGDFTENFRGKWENASGVKDNYCAWPELDQTLTKYQNPEEADKILKIKREIEDTKVIMHQAIEGILERGEKIDNLVARSEDLGGASKTFYKQAKKTNSSCCTIS